MKSVEDKTGKVAPTYSPQEYSIPSRYRRIENLHIVCWLFKDIAWCLLWKPLGIAMVFPTIFIAIMLVWKTRSRMSELCHNLSVSCWICANSYWMISEFYEFESRPLISSLTLKHLALVPFIMGLIPLIFYYLYWHPRHKQHAATL